MNKKLLLITAILGIGGNVSAQYQIDLRKVKSPQISYLNMGNPGPVGKEIRLLIKAESNFNPQTEIDIPSLRFGASTEVNFGRGCKPIRTEQSGKDLIVIFDGQRNGITGDEFAPKLLGKKKNGEMLFGYTRLPWVKYIEPILSARKPEVITANGKSQIKVVVENFGQVASKQTSVRIVSNVNGKETVLGKAKLSPIQPYGKTTVEIRPSQSLSNYSSDSLKVVFEDKD